MHSELTASLFETGGKLASDIIRLVMNRSSKSTASTTTENKPEDIGLTKVTPAVSTVVTPTIITSRVPATRQDLDYRWECCMKHLGGANILLREAYERANDEGIGEGTAEKIMEAMNEHAGMEADLEKMLAIPEAKPMADKLLSGVRSFRAAAWKAKLPTGGGTKEDVADARIWNDIMFQEAYNSAKKNPGQECVREGM